MPQKPLDISTSLFYPRAEEQQASLPGEQPYDADAARIHKSVRVCSHMVHQIPQIQTLPLWSFSFVVRLEFASPGVPAGRFAVKCKAGNK